jgi:hypothetical protein
MMGMHDIFLPYVDLEFFFFFFFMNVEIEFDGISNFINVVGKS